MYNTMMAVSWFFLIRTYDAHDKRPIGYINTWQPFSGYAMRKEKLEHLVTPEMTKGKNSKGKQREKKLGELTMWLGVERVTDEVKARRDLYTKCNDHQSQRACHLIG